MNIHVLHIIGKNRDAVASQKGYSYQQLKTIEDWLENRIANGDDEIYCEYEDDIFASDSINGKSTFKQIKLYGNDFSFASESITKSIINFFSIYVKGEYSFDKVQFDFETNVSIVEKDRKGNDAELLAEWYENQDNISEDLLGRIRPRIRGILDNYVNGRLSELAGKDDTKSAAQQAKLVYDSLKDDDFDQFIKSIKLHFNGEDSNDAVERVIANIKNLITKVPLPLNLEKTDIYFSILVNEVFQTSIQDNPQNRKLTKDQLDAILLNAGENDDKWYVEAYSQFKEYKIEEFFPGEFQTAISGASYCRWKNLDISHKNFWLAVLKTYAELPTTPDQYKRRAIYEYIFLKIGNHPKKDEDKSPIAEDKDLISFYLDSWNKDKNLQSIEADITFLQLLKGQIKRFALDFPEDKLTHWQDAILHFLKESESNESKTDRLCELYELKGHLAQAVNDDFTEGCKQAVAQYKAIIPLLNETHFYSLTGLYAQLQQMTKTLAEYTDNDEALSIIDDFMIEIEPEAGKVDLRNKAAQGLIERANVHLARKDLYNTLKALDLLHKAKDKWRLEYTRKGYAFILFRISLVYELLGMSYASKYYALIAFWSIWHSTDDALRKYIPPIFSQILHIDFRNGAWISCLSDIGLYILSKREFDERGFNIANDKNFEKANEAIRLLVHISKIIHPEISAFIEKAKSHYGIFWTDYVEENNSDNISSLDDIDSVSAALRPIILDLPLNDIGEFRTITFTALGNEWKIQFKNTKELTRIAEEFVSFVQIELCEIKQANPSLFKIGQCIEIKIEEGHFDMQHLGENQWSFFVPEFDSKVQEEINRHYLYLGKLTNEIFEDISLLSKKDFTVFYHQELLEKRSLAQKVMEMAAYQRAFKHTLDIDDPFFDNVDRIPEFNAENVKFEYVDWLTDPQQENS